MSGAFPILFVTASRIGDAVLSSGLLRRLHDEMPDATFTIAAGPVAAPLFRDMPRLQRTIVLEKRRWAGHWVDLWRQTRGTRWGLVVDMRGSGLARFLRSRRKAVNRRGAATDAPLHKVLEAAQVLNLSDDPPSPHLYVSDETQAAADALIAGEGPLLAIGPGANWAGKAWAAERFAVVAAKLLDADGPLAGGRLLLLGGPEDKLTCRIVRHALPRGRVIDLSGRVDLLTAYAALKRARVFVGNDSGLMHMAAAAGVPTLGLFGPSDERLYAPWGPYTRALRGPRDFAAYKRLDPQLNQPVEHMGDLSVASVLTAARRLLAETAGVASGQRPVTNGGDDRPNPQPLTNDP